MRWPPDGRGFRASAAKGRAKYRQFVTASIAARGCRPSTSHRRRTATGRQQPPRKATSPPRKPPYNRALAEQRATQAQLASLEAWPACSPAKALAIARGQATAAANAAAAATQRYAAAQAALNAAQGPAAASVGLFSPLALAFLARSGGLVLAAVSAFGLLFSLFSDNKKPSMT